MNRPLLLLMAAAASTAGLGTAASPNEAVVWSGGRLEETAGKLSNSLNQDRYAIERLGDFSGHSVLLVHREGNGPAEMHERFTDFYVVRDGKALLRLGGEISDAKTTEPGEVRGAEIEGGSTIELQTGDVVDIPPGTAHQIVLEEGQTITYLILKVEKR